MSTFEALPSSRSEALPIHEEARATVDASAEQLYAFLDDPMRLGAHMEKRSAMMLGGRMRYELDDAKGLEPGSVIRMRGDILGLSLTVEETVTERRAPIRKIWETRGRQKLVIMQAYRMGYEVGPISATQSSLRVFLDYRLPNNPAGRLLGLLVARAYAKWCVRRMAEDAQKHFAKPGAREAS